VEKSPDAFRTISEAAEEIDVPQHVLRFWETRFPQIKPMKRAGGRRYYRPADVDLLKGIRTLLYGEGYTIRGVQRILKEEGAAYVVGVGRGDVIARKTDAAREGAPAPGTARAAPRLARAPASPTPGRAPMAPHMAQLAPEAAEPRIVHKLSDTHAEALKAALKDLGDARRLLDPPGSAR
jgi:DNA-binding transcriptional MerR regulator